MTLQMLGNAILILALIGWIGVRQMTWRPVVVARMWRTPAILSVIGLVMLVTATKATTLTALDLTVLLVELIISLGIGAWMGAIAHMRPLPAPVAVDKDRDMLAHYESRTGPWGLVLWIAVIAVRIGIDVLASMAGSTLAPSTGIILIMLAANRAARTLVFAKRLDGHPALVS